MEGNHKKAALRLANVSEADRRWLLEKLPATERQALLDALESMEEPNPRGSEGPRATRNGHDREAECVRVLSAADAAIAAQVLAEEPDWLIAAVLSASDWPWRDAFLNYLDAYRRGLILKKTERVDAKLKPTAQHTMLELLAQQMTSRARSQSDGKFEQMLTQFSPKPNTKRRFWRRPWIR